jgi:lysophospholipase L1-like esterase
VAVLRWLAWASRRLLVPLVGLCLALLMLEAAVRVMGIGPARYHATVRIANRKGGDVQPGMTALLCYPTNYRGYFKIDLRDPATRRHYESIGMRNLDKALPTNPFAIEQRYNSQGFRGPEFPARRSGVLRVVVIGDSFNQGWGVDEQDEYSSLLGPLLNVAVGRSYEVVNAALHDADFPQLWFLFRRALELDPDVVVYGMTMNDPFKVGRLENPPLESAPLVMVRGGPLLGAPSPGGLLRSRLLEDVRARLLALERERIMLKWYADLYSRPNHRGLAETYAYIAKMRDAMRERKGRLLLMMWPMLIDLDGRYPLEAAHHTIGEFCREAGIPFLDLLDVLRGRPAASLWVHPVDRHPNDVAQRLVAEALARKLLGR